MINDENETMNDLNWFGEGSEEAFNYYLNRFAGKPDVHFLEIGSFNGISARYMFENILTHPTSTLTCIDPWKGEIVVRGTTINFSEMEKHFDKNTKPFKKQLIKIKSESAQWLAANRKTKYDFIYIDGDHAPQAVMLDLLLSFKLLKIGGIMGIDDYGWDRHDPDSWHAYRSQTHSAYAVDWFLPLYTDYMQVLEKSNKVWLMKNPTHRIYDEIYEKR
jgi:predicted O-methyltransferase YrrM